MAMAASAAASIGCSRDVAFGAVMCRQAAPLELSKSRVGLKWRILCHSPVVKTCVSTTVTTAPTFDQPRTSPGEKNDVDRKTCRLALPSMGRMAEGTLNLFKECSLPVRKLNPRQYIADIPGIETKVVQLIQTPEEEEAAKFSTNRGQLLLRNHECQKTSTWNRYTNNGGDCRLNYYDQDLAYSEGDDNTRGNYRVRKEDGGRKRAGRHAASMALQVDRYKLNQDIEKLSRKESRLLPEALIEALRDRIGAGEMKKALKVFELMRRQLWYVPQQAQYLSLLKSLAEHKQYNLASELCNAMNEDKLPPSVQIFTALLNLYVKSDHLDEAFEVFRLMKSTSNCRPDVYTYTILIQGLLQGNEIDRVVQLMDEMKKNEVQKNTVTWNTLLASFGRTGKFELMEDAFNIMCGDPSTHPDMYTWNIILKSHGRLGRIREMEEWYSRMLDMGVAPDIVTLNILIHVYGRNREFERMTNVAHHMLSLYFRWNDVTFNTMIESYGRALMIEEMEEIYRIMKAKGVKPSAFTLTTLFNAYSKERMWDKVEKIRREWKNSDIRADVIMYNSLLEAYRRSGNLAMLEKTFEELEDLLLPDLTSYDILASAYRSSGMRGKYDEVMAKLNSKHPTTNRFKPPNYSRQRRGTNVPTYQRQTRAT